jgi:enoyl-CoA hydratase/carnithine racemase
MIVRSERADPPHFCHAQRFAGAAKQLVRRIFEPFLEHRFRASRVSTASARKERRWALQSESMSLEVEGTDARVKVELGTVTRVTLNRPAQANALDVPMGLELEAALALVSREPEVKVIVLAGAGKHFSAGGDFGFIEETARLPREQVRERMLRFYRMYLSVLDVPVPTLALMQGSAIGAGLCLALACDLRLGTRSARLGANFLRVGLHPGMGATLLLPHVVGAACAARLLTTAEIVSGEQALALGLLGELAADDELHAAGQRVAAQIAKGAPLAARELVETLRAPLRAALPAALAREAECQANDFASEDLRTAIAAFRRGQPPVFTGR